MPHPVGEAIVPGIPDNTVLPPYVVTFTCVFVCVCVSVCLYVCQHTKLTVFGDCIFRMLV